jgi:hypothetical protein
MFVDLYGTTLVDLYAGRLQVQSLGVRLPSRSQQYRFGMEMELLACRSITVCNVGMTIERE